MLLQPTAMEEVGMQVVADKKICTISSNDNQSILHFWTTRIISGEAKITSNEAIDLKWVTIDEMKTLNPVFEEDIKIIENLHN